MQTIFTLTIVSLLAAYAVVGGVTHIHHSRTFGVAQFCILLVPFCAQLLSSAALMSEASSSSLSAGSPVLALLGNCVVAANIVIAAAALLMLACISAEQLLKSKRRT